MDASKDNVVISPKLQAIGVATLSGLIRNRLDMRTTAIIIMPKSNKKLYITAYLFLYLVKIHMMVTVNQKSHVPITFSKDVVVMRDANLFAHLFYNDNHEALFKQDCFHLQTIN